MSSSLTTYLPTYLPTYVRTYKQEYAEKGAFLLGDLGDRFSMYSADRQGHIKFALAMIAKVGVKYSTVQYSTVVQRRGWEEGKGETRRE